MELFAGVAMAFNLLIILHKLRQGSMLNAFIDILLFVVIVYMTSGTISGVEIGMIASAIVSYYLLKHPLSKEELEKIAKDIENKLDT